MPKNALNEDAQDNQVEHIQADMQDISMQKDRRHKTPVLSLHNRVIIFCSVRDQYIGVLAIRKHICQNIAYAMGSSVKCNLVSSQAPHRNGAHCNHPRDPGDTLKQAHSLVPINRSSIT